MIIKVGDPWWRTLAARATTPCSLVRDPRGDRTTFPAAASTTNGGECRFQFRYRANAVSGRPLCDY